MNNNNYLIDLKVSGEDLNHVDKLIRFISTPTSTRSHVLTFNKILEKGIFKNEYYIILYYIEFMCSIRNLSHIDLNAMKRLISLDKEMFVGNPNIDLNTVAVLTEDKSGLIEQMVFEKINEISSLPEVNEEEFDLSCVVMREVVKDMKVQNLLYVSSLIFFDGKKVNREELKGREGYIKFMETGLRELRKLSDEDEDLVRVDRDYLLRIQSSGKELFDAPLPTLKNSWGKVKAGDSISCIAIQNVGKTTLTINYLAESLIAGVNTALFISEMDTAKVIARTVSVVGARKYGIKIPSNIVMRYNDIENKKTKGETVTEADKLFLTNNEQKINNAVYIMNAMFSNSNKELGTLFKKENLTIETLEAEFEEMKAEDIGFLVIDHVNGVRSKYNTSDKERIDAAYKRVNSLGKKYGIANFTTNHIPEDQKMKILDKNADLSNVRGAWSTESTRSPDYVIILDASMEQKARGEFVVCTNKDRNSNTFFEPFLSGIHVDVGMVYEIEPE